MSRAGAHTNKFRNHSLPSYKGEEFKPAPFPGLPGWWSRLAGSGLKAVFPGPPEVRDSVRPWSSLAAHECDESAATIFKSPARRFSQALVQLPVLRGLTGAPGLSIRRRLIRWFHGADKARDQAKYDMAFTIEHQPLDIETAARRAHG